VQGREEAKARDSSDTKRIIITSLLIYGATALACFVPPYGWRTVGSWIIHQGSVENVVDNFTHPIARIIPLSRGDHWITSDGNPWWENLFGHPLVWYLVAMVIRMRGHGHASAFVQAGVHNVMWEYVFEGCYTPPSGVDLVMDTVGLVIGIFAYDGYLRMKTSARKPVRVLSYVVNPYRGPWEVIQWGLRRVRAGGADSG